ncbi:leucine-rich repeat-containing protein 10B-like [Acipenser ruthenus]|uniref:leucine-rich repeat-containing protein 10B-like n=1 Tax=Acipenser ruthenus TaxID=7906 RepID=UPI002740732F|nr:leucine-rich repeat-containing protein 10B-like [Acipenser ruthenus]
MPDFSIFLCADRQPEPRSHSGAVLVLLTRCVAETPRVATPIQPRRGRVPTDSEEEWEREEEELPYEVEEQLASGDDTLDLCFRKLRRLPRRVCGCPHLEKLYASNNRLRGLPEGFSELERLRVLALDFNKMFNVPPPVCRLENITRLYLGSNRLTTLPPEFSNLLNLRCLWMENNFFRRFPRQLLHLPVLKSLQLGDNRLRSLPGCLAGMASLRGLWLYGNRFEELPRVLLHMELLEILDVDRNKISRFPDLTRLAGLKLFSYDHNPGKAVPKAQDSVVLVGDGAEEMRQARGEVAEAVTAARAQKEALEAEAVEAAARGARGSRGRGTAIHSILKSRGLSAGQLEGSEGGREEEEEEGEDEFDFEEEEEEEVET